MNKDLLLTWLLEDAEKNGHRYQIQPGGQQEQYEVMLEDLWNLRGKQVDLPSLPSTPGRMISRLRSHFKDNVTLISRILNHYFPDQYLFYRVSKLEDEIFRSFEFFSSIVPEFDFSFTKVGRSGFERYLAVNASLLEFFRREYPDSIQPQATIAWFLYEGLGHLFLEKSDYSRYWILATRKENFEELDSEDLLNWSGRKEMQVGDVVFMYRASPRSAITDVFKVAGEPAFDPWGGWDGFWVDMERACRVEDIQFATLRDDPILGKWGIVRKKFMGVVTEPVPHSIYNRLLEKIPAHTSNLCGLGPEPTAPVGKSGQFVSEAEFEEQVIEPLLKRWNFDYQRQLRCRFRFGREEGYVGWVDFYVSDVQGPITLFENKHRIISDEDLELASAQAKSYALVLGLPCFVVASPEGLWVYSLTRNEEKLEERISTDELETRDEGVRSLLLKLRSN